MQKLFDSTFRILLTREIYKYRLNLGTYREADNLAYKIIELVKREINSGN